MLPPAKIKCIECSDKQTIMKSWCPAIGPFIQMNLYSMDLSSQKKKTSHGCPEHCPKLDAHLPCNMLCCPGVAENVSGSVREYSYQLVSVLSPFSVPNGYKSLQPLSMHRIQKTWFYRALLSQEGDVQNASGLGLYYLIFPLHSISNWVIQI